jgi:hypothetical protein
VRLCFFDHFHGGIRQFMLARKRLPKEAPAWPLEPAGIGCDTDTLRETSEEV